jgi:diguanylate cyclase (GGDEF)-like protein
LLAGLLLAIGILITILIAITVRYRGLKKKFDSEVHHLKGEVYKDELTGLFNRRYFTEQVEAQLDRARRSRTPVSLIMLDIDHFKRVNDTYGHLAGDLVLKNFAARLKSSVRGYDIVMRYGGEEFAVFMPDNDGKTAKISAERIRRCIEKMTCYYDGHDLKITCSIGVSSVVSGFVTLEELMDTADKAMYKSKTTGRNRVCVAPPIERDEDIRIAKFKEEHEEQNRMTIRLDMLSRVFSRAFDIVERTVFGITEYHSLRVAAMCAAMGKKLGYDEDSLAALTICALFHDNALTEYLLVERMGVTDSENLRLHCEYGQRNIKWLPFKKNVDGYILYHHERADGSGIYGKKKGEYPHESDLIAIADTLDNRCHIEDMSVNDLPKVLNCIENLIFEGFDPDDAELLKSVIDEDTIVALQSENIKVTLDAAVPVWNVSLRDNSVLRVSEMVAHITDYISEHTMKHAKNVANIAWLMGKYYGFDDISLRKLYLAASLHDIGMITVPIEIIDKLGKVTDKEYEIIKNHVTKAREWFADIPNFTEIGGWSLNHHERLDGSGYGIGLGADALDKSSRIIECIDVFDGVSSKRPYHEARTFAKTFSIMDELAERGTLDADIIADMKQVLAPFEGCEIPAPSVIND